MYDTYSDEFGMLDFQRSQHGSGMSQRSQVACSLVPRPFPPPVLDCLQYANGSAKMAWERGGGNGLGTRLGNV